jgi:hypothetical protein
VKLGKSSRCCVSVMPCRTRTELRDRITPAQLRTIQGITGIVASVRQRVAGHCCGTCGADAGRCAAICRCAAAVVPTTARRRAVPGTGRLAQPPVVAQPPAAAPSVVAQQPVVASPPTATSPDTRMRTRTIHMD